MKLRLNCDLGEGDESIDDAMMPYTDMANIACAGHAGSHTTILRTIKSALKHDVCIGAHPGYPDRDNFGRKSMDLNPKELKSTLNTQLLRFIECCKSENTIPQYCKPHGALYNDMMKDESILKIILTTVEKYIPTQILVLQATPLNEYFLQLAESHGVKIWFEIFADRAYTDMCQLAPRSQPNSVLNDVDKIIDQVDRFMNEGIIKSENGIPLSINADTLCLHGDNPAAIGAIRRIRNSPI